MMQQQVVDGIVAKSIAVVPYGSQGQSPAKQRYETRVEPRDVPPRGEGLSEREELGPEQEPEWRETTRDGEMMRGEIKRCALHVQIPLSRDNRRKRRPAQHKANETAVS
jgi:hypothetical protein